MQTATTTTALLFGLGEPANESSWLEFNSRYRPIVTGFARRMGLESNDAEDVAQETMLRFLERFRAGDYDPERGRLRSWLIGIARNCVARTAEGLSKRRNWRGHSALLEIPDGDVLDDIWEEECRAAILREAMRSLRSTTDLSPSTLEQFQQLVFEGISTAEVAAARGVSLDAVYKAKQRCLGRFKEIVLHLTELYEG